ncbi:antibiotic biosynthesis monooxygenase [Aquipuribacter nitratireducens]|uniref:Antibiotic biosynthesis monooxygenase n=1 Tax=Aquipuribacter nitratireducens TaxID=650104 RepID=A0ABW0GIW9_9MICO
MSTDIPPTTITTTATHLTSLTFLHVERQDADAVTAGVGATATALATRPGAHALDVLRSRDDSRVLVYGQWRDERSWRSAHEWLEHSGHDTTYRSRTTAPGVPRLHDVVHTDDRSAGGVSVISPDYRGAVFVNEITTRPESQQRLVELVVANNEEQSLGTPGYRSANFHRSRDGERVVNYSLWDSEDHAVDAISRMADMDRNLEETLDLASPDFRFYSLVQHWHAVPDAVAGDPSADRYAAAVRRVKDRLTPEARRRIDAVYRFAFTDGGAALLDARAGGRGWVEGDPADDAADDAARTVADFTVDLSRDDFAALVHGQLHPMAGMATGRMRLHGSMRRAMLLDRLLKS